MVLHAPCSVPRRIDGAPSYRIVRLGAKSFGAARDESNQPGYGLASYGYGGNPASALIPALRGATVVGDASEVVGEESLARCAGLHDALCGYDPDEIAEWLESQGYEQAAGDVLGFLPALMSALPMAGSLLSSFGGGGGAPAPAAAAPAPSGGGGAPGGMFSPGGAHSPGGYWPGPVIVRF